MVKRRGGGGGGGEGGGKLLTTAFAFGFGTANHALEVVERGGGKGGEEEGGRFAILFPYTQSHRLDAVNGQVQL